jgi:hypothetical protein
MDEPEGTPGSTASTWRAVSKSARDPFSTRSSSTATRIRYSMILYGSCKCCRSIKGQQAESVAAANGSSRSVRYRPYPTDVNL